MGGLEFGLGFRVSGCVCGFVGLRRTAIRTEARQGQQVSLAGLCRARSVS